MSLGHTGYLLQKATGTRLGNIADLSNTLKQTQTGSQNEKINMSQMKKQEKKQNTKLNKMKASN